MISFARHVASKTVKITLKDDINLEPDTTVLLSLYKPSKGLVLGTQRSAKVTIIDDDSGLLR